MRKSLLSILAVLLLGACSHVPDYVIGERAMEDLLVDIHKTEAVIESNYVSYSSNADKKKLREAVFLRHGVTQEQFDTTLVWYGHHIEKYMEIYERVVERLKFENEEAKNLLAQENSQTMSQPGDSIDVWKQERLYRFDSRVNNLLTFDIAPDENFHVRDFFELRFKVMMSPLQGIRPQVYMAARHANNNIVFNQVDVSGDGWTSLSLQTDSVSALSHLYGYIIYPLQPVPQRLYVDSLQLVRRHYSQHIPEVENQKSMSNQPTVKSSLSKMITKPGVD